MFREVVDDDDSGSNGAERSYARIDQDQLVAIVRAMPDARSAVLLGLAWKAARQSRLHRGEQAGEPVARLSAGDLAALTGRAIRTVRYALKSLRQAAIISTVPGGSGKKNMYRVNLIACGENDK